MGGLAIRDSARTCAVGGLGRHVVARVLQSQELVAAGHAVLPHGQRYVWHLAPVLCATSAHKAAREAVELSVQHTREPRARAARTTSEPGARAATAAACDSAVSGWARACWRTGRRHHARRLLLLPQEELLRVRAHLRWCARPHVLRDALDVLPAKPLHCFHEEAVLVWSPVARLLGGVVVGALPVALRRRNLRAQPVDLGPRPLQLVLELHAHAREPRT
jgi:hypothetical protein